MYLVRNLLRKRRLELRVSLADMARAAGYSKQHLSLVEHNRVRPSPFCQKCLAKALKVPVGEIFPVLRINDGKNSRLDCFLPRGEGRIRKKDEKLKGKKSSAILKHEKLESMDSEAL